MKRLCLAVLFAQLLCISCHSPPAQAKEPAMLLEADKLFTAGRYDAALAQYEAAVGHAGDERSRTRALFRAIECETLLGKPEAALDRARASKPPADAALRGIWTLGRLKMFSALQNSYGFANETEEGAQGSAKLSKAEAARETESALQSLWHDRQALARSPLDEWKSFLVLDGVDFVRYPSLWDFAALELHDVLAERAGARAAIDPLPFAAEDFATGFEPARSPLQRLGAVYEESAHLDGGHVDRSVAAERWRTARVMLGANAGGSSKSQGAWSAAARVRLAGWATAATAMKTPLGRADAAAKAAQLMFDHERVAALALIDRLLPKTPESDVAVELRRLRAAILAHELALTVKTTRHGEKAVHLTTRELRGVELRLYRVDPLREAPGQMWSAHFSAPAQPRVLTALASEKPVAHWHVDLGDRGDHMPVEHDVDLPAPAVGLYLVVASDDDKFAFNHSMMHAAYVNVTDLAVARVETDEGLRFYAFDADAVEPPASVSFHLRTQTGWGTSMHAEEHKGNRDGVVDWRLPHGRSTQVDALAVRGNALALFEHPMWLSERLPDAPLALFVATDRPIYRPGQKLHARVTSVERAHDGSFKVDAHRSLRLALHDANGNEVAHHDLVTGAMGSVAAEFDLPAKGLLGMYTLTASAPQFANVGAGQTVRVEEYKRPEFEVTLAAPTTAASYGQKATLGGKVQYYFGGAAGAVPVKFKVSRQRWIPWWYWRPSQSPKVEIARGEVKTDKSGHFDVSFTAVPDPEATPLDDPDAPDVSDFIVEVEAHDTGGRTIAAQRNLRIGKQALLLQVDGAHGFYFSSEKPSLHIKATNLEEQPQAAALSWTLERLGAPKDSADGDERPLQSQLQRYPAADAHVAAGQVTTTAAAPSPIALPALPAGGYRLRVTSGGGARTSYAFLVADAKTRALPPALALPPIAIPRAAESQPGERVELLLGASAAPGGYHVELWRGTHLVAHHVERGPAVRVVSIAVDEALAGGFTARWIGVAGVHSVGAQATLRVERKEKALTVQLVGKPEALQPGQKANWSLQVRDGKGRAVAGEALVTIYDRSLELYAQSGHEWADELWAPPGPPSPRSDGVRHGWGQQMPGDTAAERRREQQIAGSYKPTSLPRFSWQQDGYDGSGFGGGGFAVDRLRAVGGAPGAPPMAMPMPMMAAAPAGAMMKESEPKPRAAADNGPPPPAPPPPPVQPAGPATRTNMAETALFVPDLRLGDDGRGAVDFLAPERLSSWRVQILALGRHVEAGHGDATFVTQKPLMVRVEIPRFFREGDRSQITAVVHNETAHELGADVELAIRDDAGGHSALAALGVANGKRHVDVPAHGLVAVDFPIVAPENIASYVIHASARAGSLSDAEERSLPLLPSRERLVQSRIVALRGTDKQTIRFPELTDAKDPSLRSESLTVSIDPELALSVLRAIPSLVEYPYECVEQTLNRYVPLAIVNRIYEKHPEIAKAIAAAPHRETVQEPWKADDPRRLITMMETPWLLDSQGGGRDSKLRDLLNPTAVKTMGTAALEKLARMQSGSGGFPWFPGGRENLYMTLYALEQLGMLQEFGITPPREIVTRALAYVASELAQKTKVKAVEESTVAYLAYGSYVLTSFDAKSYPEAAKLRPDVQAWMKRVLANKQILTPFGRAWSARVMARLGDKPTALALLESALDGAKRDPLIGVYWTPERYSWMWYSDSVEKHAFFLRTLAELKPDDERVPGMLQWLLFNRKGNQWHSTKASAAAVYSILELMQKEGSLSQPQKFHVVWDKQEELVTVKPTEDRQGPLSWTVRGRDVTPARGQVELGKEGPGIAFASATWIFSSTKLQEAHGSSLIDLTRTYFRRVHQADGDHLVPLKSGDQVRVGDDLEVRLTVKSKSQLEYVQVKEPRGAGFEEMTLTSGYRWDRLPAYEEPRDTLFNFFVDWLPAGEFELRHSIRPTTPGRYRIGSAVLQSMYSPDVSAYSAGMELEVVK
jgi:uncharacterized protein YfaS (alpha-2-macroglobulin family)